MTRLRKRMINDMAIRGLSENTVRSYLNSVSGLARFYGRSPERISAQEVQDYLLHLHEQRGLSWKSCNCARHGIRFLYRITGTTKIRGVNCETTAKCGAGKRPCWFQRLYSYDAL